MTLELSIKQLQCKRDYCIRQTWIAFKDLSDFQEPDKFTEEDLDLWELVCFHSAVQDVLDESIKKESKK